MSFQQSFASSLFVASSFALVASVVACASETTSGTPSGSPAPTATATDTTYATDGEDAGDGTPAKPKAFSEAQVQALFDAKCVKCHDGRSELDLREPFVETTVGVKTGGSNAKTECAKQGSKYGVRIKAGDRAGSLLWHKVSGTHDCGRKMPYDADNEPLDANELERLGSYIDGLPR